MSMFYHRRDFSIPDKVLMERFRGLALNEEPPANALFWQMWNNCAEIADKVLETGYFKGIKGGNLDPNAYGSLMVQDAYYCFKGRDDYSAAAAHAYDEECKAFLQGKVDSYDNYNSYYHDVWCVREAHGVMPKDPIMNYADYEAHIAGHEDSFYLYCVMLPCEYLWTWVANQLDPLTPQDSVYRFWVDSNKGIPNGAYQMANELEKYRGKLDEEKANEIFRKAMEFELEVFTNSTILTSEELWKRK